MHHHKMTDLDKVAAAWIVTDGIEKDLTPPPSYPVVSSGKGGRPGYPWGWVILSIIGCAVISGPFMVLTVPALILIILFVSIFG